MRQITANHHETTAAGIGMERSDITAIIWCHLRTKSTCLPLMVTTLMMELQQQ